MKKITGLLSLIILITIAACSDAKPVEVKKEIIVVPAAPATIVKKAPEKNTTIILDKNGVKVETKKVDVTIQSDKKKQ